jgi:diguanylate cyclase (GGDEF)-like protein
MPIEFDIRTLFFIGAVASFICGAMLVATGGLHAASRPALAWAEAALAAYGVSMLLISLRTTVPAVLSYSVANALGAGAAALMYEGVRRLVGARPMPMLALGSMAGMFALHGWIGDSPQHYEARLLITSVVQGGFAAACLPLVVARARLGVDPRTPLRWAIAFLLLFTAGHAARFVITLTYGATIQPSGIVVGPGQALMPTLFSLAPMIYSLILIGLVNGRIASELWALATVDTLTGVRTRRSFIDEARCALASVRPGETSPALLMIDLDRFKQVNDRYGHVSGDRVLVDFARLLRDTGPKDAIVGRYGGEEFCLLLRATSPTAAHGHALRLCEAVRGTRFGPDVPDLAVTVSIGLAGAPDGTTLEELLLAADRRLYLAKAAGRDRVVWTDRVQGHAPVSEPAQAPIPPSLRSVQAGAGVASATMLPASGAPSTPATPSPARDTLPA